MMHARPICAVFGLLLLATPLGCKPERPSADDDDDVVGDDDDDDDTGTEPEPLAIAIDSPADGVIGTAATVTVEGTVSGHHPIVTVNGVAADVDGARFSATIDVSPDRPFTPLLAEAVDSSGWVRDRRTYVYGDSVDATEPVYDGLAIRMTDRGIDALEGYVLSMFGTEQIADLVLSANPLYEGEVLWTPVVINATDASVGGLEADLDATSDGLLIDASLLDVSIDLDVDADWAGTWPGTVTVASADLTGRAVLSAVAGELEIDFAELQVTLHGLVIDFEDIWDALEDLITGIVQGFLEDMVTDMVRDQVTAAVDSALGGLTDGITLGPMAVDLAFSDVQHDSEGVLLVLDLTISGGVGEGVERRVVTGGGLPPFNGVLTPHGDPYGAHLVLDDDAANAIGIALVSSGLLNQSLEGELPMSPPMPLIAGLLEPMFPSLGDVLDEDDPLTITTAPTVPLVGVPLPGPESALDYHMAGFMVEIAGDMDGDGQPDPIYRVALDGRMGVGLDGESGAIDVGADGLVATLIWSAIEADKTEGSGLAGLLELAVGLMVGDIVGGVTTLINGMELVPLEAGASGPAGDHLSIYADMVPAPAP